MITFSTLVPIFDTQEVCLDLSVNFENINDLFLWFEGDIPSGLCIAVGHSLMSHSGKKSDNTGGDAQVHLGTNILFTIIFGIPVYWMLLLLFTHNLHWVLSFKSMHVKKVIFCSVLHQGNWNGELLFMYSVCIHNFWANNCRYSNDELLLFIFCLCW